MSALKLLFLAFILTINISAAAGGLDPSFSGDGIATPNIPNSTFAAFPDILVQPDGKILVSASANGGTGFDFVVARFNADGTLDASFSDNGLAESPFGMEFDSVKAIALQPDGKIIAVGSVGISNSLFALVRYNPDGSLDTTFDGDGIVTTAVQSSGTGQAVAVQADGKIVVGGHSLNSSNQDSFVVIRYNANGSLDTSFATGGFFTRDFGVIDFFTGLVIQPDGKIVAGGTGDVSSSSPQIALVRLNTNGSLDSTFDGDGVLALIVPQLEEANSVDLQSDGKIIVGGTVNASMAVVRLTSVGALDTTFSGDGVALAGFNIFSKGSDARAMADGKIVAVGQAFSSALDLAVARFNADGTLDTTFGTGGRVITTISNQDDGFNRVEAQADGKIVAVGVAGVVGEQKVTVARYFGRNSSVRSDFDGDGKTDISVFRGSEGNWYLNRSTAGFAAIHWGLEGDQIVPGDYDADGKTDTAVFRPSPVPGQADFHILKSNGFVYTAISWGLPEDIPAIGDYDGDGADDTAVFRPSDGTWYVLTASGSNIFTHWGISGDVPVAGDFDGDGLADRTIFRAGGGWATLKSSGGSNFTQFGLTADKSAAADYDGDGKLDIAVFRPSDGNWYRLNSSNGAFHAVHWGQNGDVPVPGDYDGDGRYDQAVYRAGTWYLNRSTAGFGASAFGVSTDVPVPVSYPVSPSR